MSGIILQHDVIVFNTVLRSERAPTEKRAFGEPARPSYCMTKKQAKEALHAVFSRVMRALPTNESKQLKEEYKEFSSCTFMYQTMILDKVFKKYADKDTYQVLCLDHYKFSR